MKKLLSALLSCSLLCSNTFAAEKNNANVNATAAPNTALTTRSLATISNKAALAYNLIPAGLGALGLVGLTAVGIACAHSENKKIPPIPKPRKPQIPTPKHTPVPTPTPSPVPTPTSSPVTTPTSSPVPTPTSSPVPTPTSSPVPTPTSSPVPTPTTTVPDDPEEIRGIKKSLYQIRDKGLAHINNAIRHEAAASNAAKMAQQLCNTAKKNSIEYSIPDFQSERVALEKIRTSLNDADISATHAPADGSTLDYICCQIYVPVVDWAAEAEQKEIKWKNEETKWQDAVAKLRTKLGKISSSDTIVLGPNQHMPEPKYDPRPGRNEMVYADGPHTVLDIQQFRQFVANAPGNIHILFRGTHFQNTQGADKYRNAFIDEGLLVTTGEQGDGLDAFEDTSRKGHAVYLSPAPATAFSYADQNGRNGERHPMKRITFAAMTDHDKRGFCTSTVYTGYPDVNTHLVLCSDFFEYKLDDNLQYFSSYANDYFTDYDFDPDATPCHPSETNPAKWKPTLTAIRNLQIHLLRAGIVIKKHGYSVDLQQADRLLQKLHQPPMPMAA